MARVVQLSDACTRVHCIISFTCAYVCAYDDDDDDDDDDDVELQCVKVPGPGIKPSPQQQLEPLQ